MAGLSRETGTELGDRSSAWYEKLLRGITDGRDLVRFEPGQDDDCERFQRIAYPEDVLQVHTPAHRSAQDDSLQLS